MGDSTYDQVVEYMIACGILRPEGQYLALGRNGSYVDSIRLASEKPTFTVVVTIGGDRFTNSAVSIWLQQGPHHSFERWADRESYVEGFIRLVSQGAQCSQAACKNAGLRINQGAVEVQKNGASHNPR